jgi:hypothetical protein
MPRCWACPYQGKESPTIKRPSYQTNYAFGTKRTAPITQPKPPQLTCGAGHQDLSVPIDNKQRDYLRYTFQAYVRLEEKLNLRLLRTQKEAEGFRQIRQTRQSLNRLPGDRQEVGLIRFDPRLTSNGRVTHRTLQVEFWT